MHIAFSPKFLLAYNKMLKLLDRALSNLAACYIFLGVVFFGPFASCIIGSYLLARYKTAEGIFFALYIAGGAVIGLIFGLLLLSFCILGSTPDEELDYY